MLYGKIFRSTVAHGRIKSIDTSAARAVPGVYSRRHQRRRPQGHSRSLLRAGVPRPADPRDRQGASCRRAGRGRARRRSARRRAGGAADRRRVRGTAGGVRRGRGADNNGARARRAEARRHLPRSQASQGPQGHQYRARLPAAPRRRRTRLSPAAAHVFEHTFRTQQVLHLPLEPYVSIADVPRWRRDASTPPRRARPSCAPRSRACSAGRRTGCA